MSQRNSDSIWFNRPTSMALIQSYVLVHSSERPKLIYKCAIQNISNYDSALVEFPLEVGLHKITTGPSGCIIGICDRQESILLLRDDDYRLKGIPYQLSNGIITAVSFDLTSSLLTVSAATLDGISVIYEFTVSNCGFVLINTSYIPLNKITGIHRLSSKKWLIADADLDEILICTKGGKKERSIASHGREYGSVRYPDCLVKVPGGYACIVKHNYTIQLYDNDFKFIDEIGGKGRSGVSFDLASDLIYSNGFLIVADMNNDRVVSINLSDYATKVLCERTFCPGVLSRPSSFDSFGNKIVVADRDNDALQVFDNDLNFLNHYCKENGFELTRPTSVQVLKHDLSCCIAVLCRGSGTGSYLVIIDIEKNLLNHRYDELGFNDPQGMVVTSCGNLCIMDTLNRRALLFSISGSDLKLLNEVNLASLSGCDRFLCRVPSIIDQKIYFCDYHSDIVVVLDQDLNYPEIFSLDMSNFGIRHVRKIQRFDNKYFAITRGDSSLVVVDNFSDTQQIPFCLDLESLVDLLEVDDKLVFLLKEKDHVFMIPKTEFNLLC